MRYRYSPTETSHTGPTKRKNTKEQHPPAPGPDARPTGHSNAKRTMYGKRGNTKHYVQYVIHAYNYITYIQCQLKNTIDGNIRAHVVVVVVVVPIGVPTMDGISART